jgi:hypothetical protein
MPSRITEKSDARSLPSGTRTNFDRRDEDNRIHAPALQYQRRNEGALPAQVCGLWRSDPAELVNPGSPLTPNGEQMNAAASTVPLGALGTSDEMGEVAVFLASDIANNAVVA